MDLIERYVSEVGRRLPAKHRADIEKELRSTLLDMLEDRRKAAGERPADEAMIKELLLDYGPPARTAASYLPERYLVGPRLFPRFVLVLKIVGCVLAGLTCVGIFFESVRSGMDGRESADLIVRYMSRLVNAAVMAFGEITIIFAVLDRALPVDVQGKGGKKGKSGRPWTPEDLEKTSDRDRVGWSTPVFGVVFTAAWLVVLNLHPGLLAIWNMKGGRWVMTPAFFSYRPLLNLAGLLAIALNLILLRQDAWRKWTRVFKIFIEVLSAGIASVMLNGPAIVGPDPAGLGSLPEGTPVLDRIVGKSADLVLVIVIIAAAAEIIKQIVMLHKSAGARRG